MPSPSLQITESDNNFALVLSVGKTLSSIAKKIEGTASIVDKNTVKVVGKDGEQLLKCDDIVIATGSEPINIPGFTCDEKDVWSSTGALRPTEIPAHIAVIGGGYIGLELGMMYAKLGSQVTVLEATDGLLPGQEKDCIKVLARSAKKMGIKVRLAKP